MTGPRLRAALDGVPEYRAGRAAPEGAYKISSNENPFPPLPSVLKVLDDALGSINRYPDFGAADLVDALAARFSVHPDQLGLGTGSVGVAQQLVQSTAGPGDEVLYAWRSFEAYPIITQIAGATSVRVPLAPGFRHDLPAMLAAVTERTRIVFVCSPNNPTGTAVRRAELERFLDAVPSDLLVVIDEAYAEFVRDPDVPDGIELARGRPNVAVLRTFSKAYGLAALRVGFVVADEAVAAAVRKTAVPFGVNTLAQRAAIASLAAEAELFERVDVLVAERARLRDGLLALGFDVPETQANFVWVALGARTDDFAAACATAGVVVRPFSGAGVRITAAEPAATDLVFRAAAALSPPTSNPRTRVDLEQHGDDTP